MTKTCIIIPALNEEKSIGAVIKSSIIYGDVLVVNDASDDNTAKSFSKEWRSCYT